MSNPPVALRPYFRKGRAPIERPDALLDLGASWSPSPEIFADQAVADPDRALQRRQRRGRPRRMQPQRQLGDLDRGRIDVDAVDVVTQDVGDEWGLIDGTDRAA